MFLTYCPYSFTRAVIIVNPGVFRRCSPAALVVSQSSSQRLVAHVANRDEDAARREGMEDEGRSHARRAGQGKKRAWRS